MAKQKTPAKKPKKKKPGKKAPQKQTILIKVALAMALVLALAAGVAYLVTTNAPVPVKQHAQKKAPVHAPRPAIEPKPAPIEKAAPIKPAPRPIYEVFPEETHTEPVTPPPEKTWCKPRIAIIIDDLGYNNGIEKKFLKLPFNLTYSILPHSPQQRLVAATAHKNGRDVLLHLPMEPMEYPHVNPGPGALLVSMSTDTLLDVLNQDLDAVPYIKGVNNHMGSRLTIEPGALYPIFTVLKKKGLFFIDSRTTRHTICRPSARLFQLPFAQRDVFLDHVRTAEFVKGQIKTLIRLAKRNGQAIGIGHPNVVTYKVLSEQLPEICRKVELVPVSELISKVM